jgi:hypothetical protein
MDPDQAQESSERDQLWATLRTLRPAIERLAAGELEPAHQPSVATLLAKIVLAEMDFRERDADKA